MAMTFEEAEAKFRELQSRVQRGEPISRAEYEDEVSKLAVQDRNGVLWEINPRTGKWMYFDGAEWVSGAPPGHENSTVMPVPREVRSQLGITTTTNTGTPALPTPPAATPLPTTPPSRLATTPRTTTATAARPPTAPPSEPPPLVRVPATRPRTAGTAPRPPSVPPPPGNASQSVSRAAPFAGKEWLPLAIGAVVLLLCAVLLLVGGKVAVDAMAPKSPTAAPPTRVVTQSTPTRVPTPVLLPSPTSLPPTPAPVLAKVSGDSANVRNKASTSGTVLIKLTKNQQVTLIAKGPADGANVWYQVNITDKPGPAWIRSDTITIVSGDPNTLPAPGAAPAAPPAVASPTIIGAPTPAQKTYP